MAAADGSYTVTVIVGDGTYSASQTLNWNVDSPITFTPIADQTGTENVPITAVTVSGGSDVTYSAINLPLGLEIAPSSGEITGTPSVGDALNSPYSVTVIAQQGSSAVTYSSNVSFNWTVNSPVSITGPPPRRPRKPTTKTIPSR